MPSSCIVTKMSALRKKAGATGIVPSPSPNAKTGRAGASKGKKTSPAKSNDGDESMPDNNENSTTVTEEDGFAHGTTTPPPETPVGKAALTTPTTPASGTKSKTATGRVTKPRAPRKKATPKKVVDSFVEKANLKDEEGEDGVGHEGKDGGEPGIEVGHEELMTAVEDEGAENGQM